MNEKNTQKNASAGFTLIEILVVMVIIGILAVLGVGNFQSSQQKARDSARKSDLRNIVTSLEVYFNDYGSYPVSTNGYITACTGLSPCQWGEAFIDDNGTVYMVTLPSDPRSNQTYYYDSLDGRSFQLYARLENILDRDVPKDSQENAQVYSNTNCGIGMCNYGVASSNSDPLQNKTLLAE
jgi:type II secretion system protein G